MQGNGVYRHHDKGDLYTVVGEGIHTETGEELVFYKSSYDKMYARPKGMFYGLVLKNGKYYERFERVFSTNGEAKDNS